MEEDEPDSTPDTTSPSAPDPALLKYREWLVKAEHQASQDFDKAVLTLAAGAIGLSLAFLDPKMGPVHASAILGLAWLALAGSLLASLASLLTSRKALRTGIEQVDSGRIRSEEVGGKWSSWTEKLNIWAAGLLVAGVVFLVLFAWLNIGRVNNGSEAGTPKTPATTLAPPGTQGTPPSDLRTPGTGQGLSAPATPGEVVKEK